MMSSVHRTCVCVRVRVRRDCVSHTARSRDRTRAGIISPPRGKISPFPLNPLNEFVPLFTAFPHWSGVLRSSFIANILGPSNESPLILPCRFLVHDPERKESFGNLCYRTYTKIYERKPYLLRRPVILMSRLFRLTRPDISRNDTKLF